MIFERAAKREKDSDDARRREQKVHWKREELAQSLKVCFLNYANGLYRHEMKGDRRGTVVTFTDDWKVADVSVESATTSSFANRKKAEVTRAATLWTDTSLSETAFMDKSDARARMKERRAPHVSGDESGARRLTPTWFVRVLRTWLRDVPRPIEGKPR